MNNIKIHWMMFFLSLGVILGKSGFAAEQETFYVNKPSKQVISLLENNLQRCIVRKASLFRSGIMLNRDTLDGTTIYHVIMYQTLNRPVGDFGTIAIATEKGKTVVGVNNRADQITGTNFHITESVKKWLSGSKECVPADWW